MKLELQVCSLELAKRLKELGVMQKSLFWWVDWDANHHSGIAPKGWNLETHPHEDCPSLSAFTVAELGEILPPVDGPGWVETIRFKLHWRCEFRVSGQHVLQMMLGPTEADARAKMLIYLLENKLIASNS